MWDHRLMQEESSSWLETICSWWTSHGLLSGELWKPFAGKLRLSDGGHVSRKLCPPQKRRSSLIFYLPCREDVWGDTLHRWTSSIYYPLVSGSLFSSVKSRFGEAGPHFCLEYSRRHRPLEGPHDFRTPAQCRALWRSFRVWWRPGRRVCDQMSCLVGCLVYLLGWLVAWLVGHSLVGWWIFASMSVDAWLKS